MCKCCGEPVLDSKHSLCEECRRLKKEKAKEKLISVGKAVGIAAAAAATTVLAFLAASLSEDDHENNYYSNKWLRSASDDELETEREKVRLDYCSAKDIDEADRLYWTLDKFDDEMSRRAWCDEEPHAPNRHREHGWYLDNDD